MPQKHYETAITVEVRVSHHDLMLLGRLTGCNDAQETIQRVIAMTIAMTGECCDG